MKNQANKHWLVKPNAFVVAEAACETIKEAARVAIQKRGTFKIVLAGGTTPEHIYKMLAKTPCDWQNWEIYLGDERCLPTSSANRNSQMIQQSWLDAIDIPSQHIHFIKAELGSELAATDYAATIIDKMPFDLVLLGMGEDGHTASLFPDHVHNNQEVVHAVHNAPKPPSERVSLSASSLSNSHQVLIIITGTGKQASVEAWKKDVSLPITEISALDTLTIMLDEDASPSVV